MSLMKLPVSGIDLGTSESRIAVWKGGKIEIIPNSHTGKKFTPSYVSFRDNQIFVGDLARQQMSTNPKNTLFEVKRLIGRGHDGSIPPIENFGWPFQLLSCTTGKARISVTIGRSKRTYHPESVMYQVLEVMLSNAQKFLRLGLTQAVMTVPAYFNEFQREQATSEVADMAKIRLIRVIDSCTAAALAYCHNKGLKNETYVLVYDMGTYVFQASVMKVTDFHVETIASQNDLMLGGKILDRCLVSHCLIEIMTIQNLDLRNDLQARIKLYPACEEAKKTLSIQNETTITVHRLRSGYKFTCKISRQQFERLVTGVISVTLDLVERALSKAGLERSQIEHVVLVGGSTRIPKLREMVKDFFNLHELNQCIEPEDVLVYGAAVEGAIGKSSMMTKGVSYLQGNQIGMYRTSFPLKNMVKETNPPLPNTKPADVSGKDMTQRTSPNRKLEAAARSEKTKGNDHDQNIHATIFQQTSVAGMIQKDTAIHNTGGKTHGETGGIYPRTQPTVRRNMSVSSPYRPISHELHNHQVSSSISKSDKMSNKKEVKRREQPAKTCKPMVNQRNELSTQVGVNYSGGILQIITQNKEVSSSMQLAGKRVTITVPFQDVVAFSGCVSGNEVILSINSNGILHHTTCKTDAERQADLLQMKKEALLFRKKEEMTTDEEAAKCKLQDYVYSLKSSVEAAYEGNRVSEEEKNWARNECYKMLDFLEVNYQAQMCTLLDAMDQFTERFQPIRKKLEQ